MASNPETVGKPHDWGNAVYAAYLYQVLDSMREVAEYAGIGYRTIQRWVHSEWWPEAEAQAYQRFLKYTDSAARRGLARALTAGNVDVVKWYLERRDPSFAPAAQKLDVRLGVQGFIASLSPEEVRRINSLPDHERRAEVQRLLGSGDRSGE